MENCIEFLMALLGLNMLRSSKLLRLNFVNGFLEKPLYRKNSNKNSRQK